MSNVNIIIHIGKYDNYFPLALKGKSDSLEKYYILVWCIDAGLKKLRFPTTLINGFPGKTCSSDFCEVSANLEG